MIVVAMLGGVCALVLQTGGDVAARISHTTVEDAAIQERSVEYLVKARMIKQFGFFTTWPKNVLPKGAPLVIGVMGKDPFTKKDREALTTNPVRTHKVVIRNLTAKSKLDGIHILFVPAAATKAERKAALTLKGKPVLLIGEDARFMADGGTFNFVIRKRRVRFQINNGRARKAGLKIGTKVLRLAVK